MTLAVLDLAPENASPESVSSPRAEPWRRYTVPCLFLWSIQRYRRPSTIPWCCCQHQHQGVVNQPVTANQLLERFNPVRAPQSPIHPGWKPPQTGRLCSGVTLGLHCLDCCSRCCCVSSRSPLGGVRGGPLRGREESPFRESGYTMGSAFSAHHGRGDPPPMSESASKERGRHNNVPKISMSTIGGGFNPIPASIFVDQLLGPATHKAGTTEDENEAYEPDDRIISLYEEVGNFCFNPENSNGKLRSLFSSRLHSSLSVAQGRCGPA